MVYPHVMYLGPAYPDRSNERTGPMIRELDSRISNGIYVRLLWHSDNGQVSITVNDAKTGETFELVVRDRERALDVYHHPFAYAAERRRGDEMSATPSGSGAAVRRSALARVSKCSLMLRRIDKVNEEG